MLRLFTEHASDTGTSDDVAYFRGSWLGLNFVSWVPAVHAEPQEALGEDAHQCIWKCCDGAEFSTRIAFPCGLRMEVFALAGSVDLLQPPLILLTVHWLTGG